MYAVIVENDESQWSDQEGVRYHFPKRYSQLLETGTHVVYYKGRMRDGKYADRRLSAEPHYFGVAAIGKVGADPSSSKGDLFADILGFQRFTRPVLARDQSGRYLEQIPANRQSNYWRDGVRRIDEETYRRILAQTVALRPTTPADPPSTIAGESSPIDELESWQEGSRVYKFVATYERDPRNRRMALAHHGYRCVVCMQTMEELYGEHGVGLIHIHHTVPVSEFDAPRTVDPVAELVPVCPNCHSIIHRKRTATLSIEEARNIYKSRSTSK